MLVVYDNLGIYSSPRVWWLFKVMGFNNIAVLNGGLPEWIKHNYPQQANLNNDNYPVGNFEVNFQSALVKSKKQIETNGIDQKYLVIDARFENRFYGKIKENRADLISGHIPNAVNVPYASVLDKHIFLLPKKLKSVLHHDGRPLIVYCGSGVTACIVILAYALINVHTSSIYDGSWAEWGQKNELL